MSIFMNYKKIKGEASDSGHEHWIDIDSYNLKTRRPLRPSNAENGLPNADKAVLEDLILVRRTDQASPGLMRAAFGGTSADLVLHITQTGEGSGSNPFLELTFRNALLRDYSQSGGSQAERRPKEHITVTYTAIEARFITHDDRGFQDVADTLVYDTTTSRLV